MRAVRATRLFAKSMRGGVWSNAHKPVLAPRNDLFEKSSCKRLHIDAYILHADREADVDEVAELVRAERQQQRTTRRQSVCVDLHSGQSVEEAAAYLAEATAECDSASEGGLLDIDVSVRLRNAQDLRQQNHVVEILSHLLQLEQIVNQRLLLSVAVLANWEAACVLREQVIALACEGSRVGTSDATSTSTTTHSVSLRSSGVCVHPPLTVVFGPMFAGKSSRLVDFYEKASTLAAPADLAAVATSPLKMLKVEIVKPALDWRSAADVVETHDGRVIRGARSFSSLNFKRDFLGSSGHEMGNQSESRFVDVVVVDEGHFFDAKELEQFVRDARALRPATAVCVAGLDLDYRRHPFEPMAAVQALPQARLEHLTSTCKFYEGVVEADDPSSGHACDSANKAGDICGSPAMFSARRINVNGDTLLVGGAESYLPLCDLCYEKYHEPRSDGKNE